MKHQLESLINQALQQLRQHGDLPAEITTESRVERTRDRQHGDFASNAAMVLTRVAKRKPRDLAQLIMEAIPSSPLVNRVEIAGPGFINFFLTPGAYHQTVGAILAAGDAYGRSALGAHRPVQVEFVSANPTGPLHVGHGRGAAYGAAVANLLVAAGFRVHREYYVNDAGRQMDILAASVWLRYLEALDERLAFPVNGYKGGYVRDIAASLRQIHGDKFHRPATEVMTGLPADAPAGGDKEEHIDAIIARAQALLGAADYRIVFDAGLNMVLADIRQDLEEFGVVYDDWYSERSLTASGAVTRALQRLKAGGHAYEQGGALWFRATDFGDEKDRVLVRDNGQTTYFASDIAYHMDKLERGFERVIDVWGADHHGYVPRVKAALRAMGDDPARLDVLLVQFAILYKGGERMQMSTRAGEFVTLRELRDEVGNDAARFFYVTRKCEQHMDFDLDLAKSQSADNPVYYIQYAHARVCSVLRQLDEKRLQRDERRGNEHLHLLHEEHELKLMVSLSRYPEVVEAAALNHEPHLVAHYLRELAYDFHTYYNSHQFLVEEDTLRDARLNLILATRQVIRNGLALLGVSAPESM
ncbi:MAG: arginine--tRNA ligase [Gammaproteobacteria bacterium]